MGQPSWHLQCHALFDKLQGHLSDFDLICSLLDFLGVRVFVFVGVLIVLRGVPLVYFGLC